MPRKFTEKQTAFILSSLSNRDVAKATGLDIYQVRWARVNRGLKDYHHERLSGPKGPRGKKMVSQQEIFSRVYHRWTKSAIYCKESGAACFGCPNYRFYGLHKDGDCKMPEAIQILERLSVTKGIKKNDRD